MGSQLEQVKVVCCQLDDKRITTRKKAEEQLRDLLNNNVIVGILDRVSSSGSGRDWTWQDVYRTSFGFFKKEIDRLIEDARKETKTSAAARNAKKLTAIGIYKSVIKQGRDHLVWSSVMTDLLQCLDHPFIRNTYCDDILSLINEAVTSANSRSMLIVGTNKNQWMQILAKVLDLFEDPPASIDPLNISSLLHQVIKHGTQFTTLLDIFKQVRIWRILKELIVSDKFARGDSEAKLEVVRASNCLMRSSGLSGCREKIVKFGELTVRDVIRAWNDKKEESKAAVLDFMSLQIIFHHPGSLSEISDGAMYEDRGVWTQQLKRIFLNITETSIKNKMRLNKQKNSRLSKDYFLSPGMVWLGAEVLFQLDQSPDCHKAGDVTQIVDLDETQQGPPKRRRVDLEDQTVIGSDMLAVELIKTFDIEEMRIPWLQLLAELYLNKTVAEPERDENYVKLMVSLMSNTKSTSVRDLVCKVLFLLSQRSNCQQQEWVGIGQSLVTLLGGNQLAEHGHLLLRSLLKHSQKLKLCSADIYGVFRNRLIKLDQDSGHTLLMLLRKFPINDVQDKMLREQLIIWISVQLTSEHCPLNNEKIGPVLIRLLLHLTLKSSMSKHNFDEVLPRSLEALPELNVLNENLLKLICRKSLVDEDTEGPEDLEEKVSQLVEASECVNQMFISVAGHVLDNLQMNKEHFIVVSCHLLGILTNYLSLIQDNSRLDSLQGNIYKDIQKSILNIVSSKNSTSQSLQMTLRKFGCALSCLVPGFAIQMKDIQLLISKLCDLVMETCKKKEKYQAKISQCPSVRSRSRSRDTSPDPFEDFDTFESMETSHNDDFEMLNVIDTTSEKEDLKFLHQCIEVLAQLSKFVADKSSLQKSILEKVLEVLNVYDFNEGSIDMIVPVLKTLRSVGMEEEAVKEVGNIFMKLASESMSKTSFDYHGILELSKGLLVMIPPLGSHKVSTRAICIKILTGLVKQNLATNNSRLGPEIMKNICLMFEQFSHLGPDGAWATWTLHNQVAPALAVDSDQEVAVFQSLPGFLLSSSGEVRILASAVFAKMCWKADKKLSPFKHRIIPVIESNKSFGESYSALLGSIGSSSLSLSGVIISFLLLLNSDKSSGLSTDQLLRAVECMARQYKMDARNLLMRVLPLCLEDFLSAGHKFENFPIELFGFSSGQIDRFICEHENSLLPLILLNCPTQDCLGKLKTWLKRDEVEILKSNLPVLARYFMPGLAAKEFKIEIEGKQKCIKLGDFVAEMLGDEFANSIIKNFKSTISQIYLAVNDAAGQSTFFKFKNKKKEQIQFGPLELKCDIPDKVIQLIDKVMLVEVEANPNIWKVLSIANMDAVTQIAVDILSTIASEDSSDLRSVFCFYLWLDSIQKGFCEEIRPFIPFLAKYASSLLLQRLHAACDSNHASMEDFSRSVLLLINKLVRFIMENDVSAMLPILDDLNYGLITCILKSGWKLETKCLATEVLKFLTIENKDRYAS